MTQIPVFKGGSSSVTLKVFDKGKPLHFDYATRMRITFQGTNIVADSDLNAQLFDWSNGDGELVINLSSLSLYGLRPFTLYVYDPTHPNGQPVISPLAHDITFRFV